MWARPLVGREHELALLENHLSHLGERGTTLIVRGEAGVGKSALLAVTCADATARGMATLTSAGTQSETHVAFAGLHRLLRPVLTGVDRLPLPQRSAIQTAFGIRDTAEPDLFMIALATLELLSEAAAAAPLLLAIEDADLLDAATVEVLMFVARRIELEPIFMLLAVRDGTTAGITSAGLAELHLGPLDEASSIIVLDSGAGGLPRDVRRRILAEALGNPLALIELPRAVADGFDLAPRGPLPLTERLERAFAVRVAALSSPVRSVLLVAALDDGGDQERILGAASILEGRPLGAAELTAAQEARAITVDGDEMRFRHPLVRSAIFHSSLAAERRAAHQALAKVYEAEPDRTAWHRAASLSAPDDEIAAELEAVGERAVRRGAAADAVAALDRAARISLSEFQQGRRLLRAASVAYDFGLPDVSTALVRRAQQLDLPPQQQTTVLYLLELGRDDAWSGAVGIRSLVETADKLCLLGDIASATHALAAAAVRCWWENPDQETRDRLMSVLEAVGLSPDDPRAVSIRAHADPVRCGSEVIKRIAAMTPDLADPAGMALIGSAANSVWAYDVALPFLGVAVDGLRAERRPGLLARALLAQAWAAVHMAREPLAVSAAEEAIALARDTGQPQVAVLAGLAKATIAAERGDFAVAEVLAREAEAVIMPAGAAPLLAMVQFVRGRGAVAHQHYAAGLLHLRRALDPTDPAYHPFVGAWGLSDLVEASAHTGATEDAQAYLAQLEAFAAQTSGSLLRATAGYARAISAVDDDAEALFATALGSDLVGWPCYRGRMFLWSGRWLRRQRRAVESRAHLRAALDGFEALAFSELAQTARQELRASGEKPEEATSEAWALLTPQELQIAQMASAGKTNRAIGQQLFLSPRTVQSHMYRIFPKLGITARTQLRDVISAARGASG